MIKDIEQKIKETTIEAIDLAKRMQEVTNEGFIIRVTIPKKLRSSTVTIQGAKRPFPVREKFQILNQAIRGNWKFEHTNENFTKLTSIRHGNPVKLVIYLYTERCLDPNSFENVEVLKGRRGRVLTPEMCNGFETPLLRGLGIEDKRQKEESEKQ